MNNQIKQDILTIESNIKSLHQTYLNLKVLEGTHAQKLSSDQQKLDNAFQAAQQNIKNIQRNYQNRIEADKDFLAELTAMVSQLHPKYTKEYKPGFATCPQSINMNHIRVFYEMVIKDTAESFYNRLWKKNGYYDFYRKECVHRKADILLGDGDVIDLGNERLTVIHTPGHSLGSVCYLGDGFIVTGDTLFADTIGRCDLFGGSSAQMEVSLERLRTLDGALRIYPGHGAPSLLGSALVSAAYYF